MKQVSCAIFYLILLNFSGLGQVSQFPQIYYSAQGSSGQQIRSSPSTSSASLGIMVSNIAAVDITNITFTPYGVQNWIKVCMPDVTGNISYGYMLCNEYYARINEINNYATVTATSLNIRTGPGTTFPNITISGVNARYGNDSRVALTGNSSAGWYEVYLPTNCNFTQGWVSGSFLSINSNTTNYRNVGGRVCTQNSNCTPYGDLGGATINFGIYGSTISSGEGGGNSAGFYEYKLPINASTNITCSHPNYNSPIPGSYSHVANNHNYTRNFLLSNAVSCIPPNIISHPENVNENNPVNTSFAVLASGGTAPYSYQWQVSTNGGTSWSNITSSGSNPSFTNWTSSTLLVSGNINEDDNYEFRCKVSSASPCSSSFTISDAAYLRVPPVADFYSTPSGIVVAGQIVSFINESSNNSTSSNWRVERQQSNGSYTIIDQSTQQNPTFLFNTPACYRIRLISSNTAGSDTDLRPCYIYAKPNLDAPIPADVTRAQKYYTYKGGDPVNLANGTFTFSMRDFSIPGIRTVLDLERRYFSDSQYEGPFGKGWHHSLDLKIDFSDPFDWKVHYPDGHFEHYVPYINGETRSLYPGNFDTLSYTSSGGNPTSFLLTKTNGTKWNFTSDGLIASINDINNNVTAFSYSGGKLAIATLPGGRQLFFTYNPFDKISAIADDAGRTVYYFYDAAGINLDSTRIENSTTSFKYGPHGMTEVFDPRGNRIVQNIYNPQGQVIEQYDAANRKTVFSYNTPSIGQTTLTDPTLKSKILTHDNRSRCINISNELNHHTGFGFSFNNTLDTIIDGRGFRMIMIHDEKGRLVKTTDAKGYSDSIGYTAFGSPAFIRDKEENIYKIIYNSTENPIEIILPTNDTIRRFYDPRGLDTLEIDTEGNRVSKIYNSYGDLIQTISPTSITNISYDAVGRPVEVIDSYGRKDSLFWNHFDQVIKTRDKMGFVEEFGFDSNGNQVLHTDKNGNTTLTEFNLHDKPVKITNPLNHISQFEYDDNQRLFKSRNPNKNTLIFSYDDAGRQVSIADSVLGILSQSTYDPAGNLVTQTDALHKIWTYRVDEINRITSTINPLGDSIQYKYNRNGLKIEQIDEEGKSTKWEYDAVNRHIKTIDARNNYIEKLLNKNGLLKSVRDARGNTRSIATYDGSGRMLTLNDGFGNYTLTWDSSGNIKSITDPDNRTLDHFYNASNELLEIKQGAIKIREYLLDNNGDYLAANASAQNATVSRDLSGRITHYTDNYSNTIEHVYDSVGNIKKIIYPGGKVVEYKYNSLNKCIEAKDWNNNIYIIVRNKNGDIESIQYPNAYKTEISRDDASRVGGWFNKNALNSIYHSNLLQRDKTGNILKDSGLKLINVAPAQQYTTGSYGNDDRILTYGSASINSNLSGQRTQFTSPGESFLYGWSVMGELENSTHTGSVQTMQYDAFNERVIKTTGNSTTRYIIDHYLSSFPIVLQERDDGNSEITNYLFIPDDGIVLARDSAGTVRYYHHDVRGNIIALSDVSGQLTDLYNYGEFGDSIYHSGASSQPFTWLGMYGVQHDGNGLYYLHARYYDGKTGTFTSQDPYPVNYFNTQDVNRYTYGYNNPYKYVDPTGLYPQNILSASWQDFIFNVASNVVSSFPNFMPDNLHLKGRTAKRARAAIQNVPIYRPMSIALNKLSVAVTLTDVSANGWNYNNALDLAVTLGSSTQTPFAIYISWIYLGMDAASLIISNKDFGENLDEFIKYKK